MCGKSDFANDAFRGDFAKLTAIVPPSSAPPSEEYLGQLEVPQTEGELSLRRVERLKNRIKAAWAKISHPISRICPRRTSVSFSQELQFSCYSKESPHIRVAIASSPGITWRQMTDKEDKPSKSDCGLYSTHAKVHMRSKRACGPRIKRLAYSPKVWENGHLPITAILYPTIEPGGRRQNQKYP